MNETKQFILMEICYNKECSEYSGGWKNCDSDNKAKLVKMAEEEQPGTCPNCYDDLFFEVWSESDILV